MQACCSLALSFYTCCLKNNFTVLWSHVSFAILLIGALGVAIAVHIDNFIFYIIGAVVVALWVSLLTLNSMSIHSTLSKNDGFYAALRSQADWSNLCRRKCSNKNSELEAVPTSPTEKKKDEEDPAPTR